MIWLLTTKLIENQQQFWSSNQAVIWWGKFFAQILKNLL